MHRLICSEKIQIVTSNNKLKRLQLKVKREQEKYLTFSVKYLEKLHLKLAVTEKSPE